MIFGSQRKQRVDPDADFSTSIFNFASVRDFEDIRNTEICDRFHNFTVLVYIIIEKFHVQVLPCYFL